MNLLKFIAVDTCCYFASLPVLLSFDFYGLSGPLVGQPVSQMGQQVGQPAATGTGLSFAPTNFPKPSGGDEEEGPLRLCLHDHCQQEVLLGWLLGELQLKAPVMWGLVDQKRSQYQHTSEKR